MKKCVDLISLSLLFTDDKSSHALSPLTAECFSPRYVTALGNS